MDCTKLLIGCGMSALRRLRPVRSGLILSGVLLATGCAAQIDDGQEDAKVEPAEITTEITNEAPPWAQLPGGGTVVGPEFRGWTEWPFTSLDHQTMTELGVSRFETDQRLVFLNVMACVPKSDVTIAYGWGLLDSAGELLNPLYSTITLDWLEAPYRQPDGGSCGEGWVGVLIDHDAEPVSVVWSDAWHDLDQTWPLGSPINPADIAPVAPEVTIARFGDEAEASSGSYWTVLDLVAVPANEAATTPPTGTTWWIAETQYCAPPGDDRIWDGLQLAVDGWYVFNRAGREIALDAAHRLQDSIGAGECGLIWETFAIPVGLEPSHVRLSSDTARTIWPRQG